MKAATPAQHKAELKRMDKDPFYIPKLLRLKGKSYGKKPPTRKA